MLFFYLSIIEDAKDRFAFEDLFMSIEQDVVNYANKLVHNKNDAEDIAQEAWLCVAKNIASFRANHYKSVKNYVFKVVRYRAEDYRENKKQEPEFFEDMDVFPLHYEDCDVVLSELCEKASIEEIKECILKLPEIYKDVLNLYFLNENNPYEIANILGIKASAARQRLHRGRDLLIFILQERGFQ